MAAEPIWHRVDRVLDDVYSVYDPDVPYIRALETVQANVSMLLRDNVEQLPAEELKDSIRRCIRDREVKCDRNVTVDELTEWIYHDMAGLSFISRDGLLEQDGFEEININAWNDVEIMRHGKRIKTAYTFASPTQAVDIHLRMFRRSQTPFDMVSPRATADIGGGVRITALRCPIVDAEVGVSSSIRKVDLETVTAEMMLEGASLTEEMLTLLLMALLHGVSICISGETGAGKTTLAGCLLTTAAETKRIYTIEEGSREWELVKRDETGKPKNSVIHTRTRPNDDPKLHIDQELLVKDSLRFDADIIAPGEIRGREALEVMGVSNTGHTVLTTIHSNGTGDTPDRMVELAKKTCAMSDDTLYQMAARAFPLLVHMEKCPDRVRRVTEIAEMTGYRDGAVQTRMLYEYEVQDNLYEGEECIQTVGSFVKKGIPSDGLQKKLLKKGVRRSELERFVRKGGDKYVSQNGNFGAAAFGDLPERQLDTAAAPQCADEVSASGAGH